MSERLTLGIVGLLILAAFPLYGGGQVLLAGESWKTGLFFCLANSAAVVMIGILMRPIITADRPATARIYMAARIGEGLLLAIGVLVITGVKVANLSGDDFYRLGMVSLGLGSLFMCLWLVASGRIHRAIGWLGFVGYLCLVAAMVAADRGQGNLSMGLLVPGAIFEVIFGALLVLGKVKTNMPSHA